MVAYPQSPVLELLAATPEAGFALQNATPTILSWTAPNDGNLHRAKLIIYLLVTSGETGGNINIDFTDPSNTSRAFGLGLSGKAAGEYGNQQYEWESLFAYPGTTVTLVQSSALTGGAATVWAEIWGS
jgi:hypothetical protein